MASQPTGGPDQAASPEPRTGELELRSLSPRQQQILALLRAGKVNKEIAEELGIGLGTVKQHVVALFKKLHVRNRTMAVSRGAAPRPNNPTVDGSLLTAANLLERRPCCVLSLALPNDLPSAAGRLLQQTLAAHAFDHGAVFLARQGHAGDLIFGVQRAGRHDPLRLLRAARLAADALAGHDAGLAEALRCGIGAGLAIVSVDRQGNWSGEVVASPTIAEARDLAREALPGNALLGGAFRELLDALAPYAAKASPQTLPLAELDRLPWRASDTPPPQFGREADRATLLDQLEAAASGDGRLVYIEGEVGMGKSLLCRHIAEQGRQRGFQVEHLLFAPELAASRLYRLPDGAAATPETSDALFATPASTPTLIVVDDLHHLAEAQALAHRARNARGCLVVLAARRLPDDAPRPDARIRLGRLPQSAIERVALATTPGLAEDRLATIARLAAGVPLFAVQLARAKAGETLPLPLRLVVAARIDRLMLDRPLLHQVARAAVPPTLADLTKALTYPEHAVAAAIAQAVSAGALRCDELNRLTFTHPLLRLALAEALVD